MSTQSKLYTNLSQRSNFNGTLRYVVSVTDIVGRLGNNENICDILCELLQNQVISQQQILPIIALVLKEKLKASYISKNLDVSIDNKTIFSKLAKNFSRWNAIDTLLAYHHPYLGVSIVNPARLESWESIEALKENELIVFYAYSRKGKIEVAEKAIVAFFKMLHGQKVNENPDFIGSIAPKVVQKNAPVVAKTKSAPGAPSRKASPKPEQVDVPTGALQHTPKYSVQVTNELFHNGNVEAWKNIIESYHLSHANCKVIVYHEGELIQDLNALFKWGKVKNGGVILFQVVGPLIKNVSRLQKYLIEGASPRFEAFMKHDVNKTLQLF